MARGHRESQPAVVSARLSLRVGGIISGGSLRAFPSAGAKNREGVSTPAPPPPTQAGFHGPKPATAGSSRFRAGGWSPCARAARCPLTSGVCGARAGGRRAEGCGGSRSSSSKWRLRVFSLRTCSAAASRAAPGARWRAPPARSQEARSPPGPSTCSCLPLPPPPPATTEEESFIIHSARSARRPQCAGAAAAITAPGYPKHAGTCSPGDGGKSPFSSIGFPAH